MILDFEMNLGIWKHKKKLGWNVLCVVEPAGVRSAQRFNVGTLHVRSDF